MRRVLLVCLDNLGDLVFTSSLAASLSQDPELQLSLWCKEYTSRLGHLLPGVQQVFAADPFWDKAPGRAKGSLRLFLRTLRTIRKNNYSMALIPSSCWRTALFLKLAGIPIRVGLAGKKNRHLLTHMLPRLERNEPVVAALLRSFAAFLPKSVPAETVLDRNRLPQLGLPLELSEKPLVCLHAFAGRMNRCVPLPILRSLAHELDQRGYRVLWMGTTQELAQLRVEDSNLPAECCVDYWAQDLLSISWLIAQARLFIGHDSGPLHVAGALGIPVLGFYLPGEPQRTFPQGRGAAVMVARESATQLTRAAAEAGLQRILTQVDQVVEPNRKLVLM